MLMLGRFHSDARQNPADAHDARAFRGGSTSETPPVFWLLGVEGRSLAAALDAWDSHSGGRQNPVHAHDARAFGGDAISKTRL